MLLSMALLSASFSLFAADDAGSMPSSRNSTVVLDVDGDKLTFGDVERKHYGAVFQANNAFYQAERKAIDDFIGDYVVERQAKREGLTVEKLLEKHAAELMPKDPSEEALRLYYEATQSPQPYEEMRKPILDHIREGRMNKAKAAYIASLRANAKVAVRLAAPRITVSLKNTPVRGDAKSPVTIVEYADYECPYCQQAQPTLDKIFSEYEGKVAFAYKDVPLPMHAHAQKAAEAALCAGAQGKYWEFHDVLFSEKKLDIPELKESATALKLDAKAFDTCLDSGAKADLVKASADEGHSLQLEGTPSFIINGRFFKGGMTYEQLKAVVEEELTAAQKKAVAENLK